MANLDCLVTKTNADEGLWFRVVLYGKEQPFSVKILGADSDVVITHAKEKLRKLRNKSKDDMEDSFDLVFDSKDEDVLIRMCELRSEDGEPIIINGKEIKNTKKDFEFLIEKIPALKEFILEKSNERKNFLSKAKKD